ncbi:hypothetical protein Y1Q_0005425 [Alligator mississippiensis]|uniref:Uncharacterized protein n=1 Tax=Alligator mississippiensis TaxID=8496 RepID=A0A151MZL4_ALLMI|nr:hypothetical protein Y1Q_0005425 [Alligator mississippiensis]
MGCRPIRHPSNLYESRDGARVTLPLKPLTVAQDPIVQASSLCLERRAFEENGDLERWHFISVLMKVIWSS